MTDLYNQKENTRRFREALIKDLEDAEQQRDHAEQLVKRCRQKLRAFDMAFFSTDEITLQTRGATAAVRRAIIVQGGEEFTPTQIKKTIDEVFPSDAVLLPDVQSVTRVLAKLTLAGQLDRVVQGAGLKSPVYQAISKKLTATAARLLPD